MESMNGHRHMQQDSPKDDHRAHKSHDQHAGHSPGMFRDKFWLSLILTLPVVFWSEHIQMLLGYQAPEFFWSAWIPPVLGTIIFFIVDGYSFRVHSESLRLCCPE